MSTAKFRIIPFVNYTTKYYGKLDVNVIPVVTLLKVYNEVVVADVLYCRQLISIRDNQNNILDKVYQSVNIDSIQKNIGKELTYKEYNALLRGIFKGETFGRYKIDMRYSLCALEKGLIIRLVGDDSEFYSNAISYGELNSRAYEVKEYAKGCNFNPLVQLFLSNPQDSSLSKFKQDLLAFNWQEFPNYVTEGLNVLEYNLTNIAHMGTRTTYIKINNEYDDNEPKIPEYK